MTVQINNDNNNHRMKIIITTCKVSSFVAAFSGMMKSFECLVHHCSLRKAWRRLFAVL